MLIGSGSMPQMASGAEVALRLLGGQTNTPATGQPQLRLGSGNIDSLLGYAKTAQTLARQGQSPGAAYDPASDVPPGHAMGPLVAVDTLEPEYRDFARGLGATHVRLITADPVSNAVFAQRVQTYLDESYGADAAYLAARAAGHVTISRQSDVTAALGDTRAGWQGMAFFRGPQGSEYFGGGGTGIGSAALEKWWAAQNAAGRYVVPGAVMGLDFVASWAAA